MKKSNFCKMEERSVKGGGEIVGVGEFSVLSRRVCILGYLEVFQKWRRDYTQLPKIGEESYLCLKICQRVCGRRVLVFPT